MKSEIIAVGTELLLGQIVNTNAQYISRELSALGIDLYYQSVVGDNPGRLKEALNIAFGRVDTVFLTGGLGPTKDDLTKETVAAYFGLTLALHQPSLDAMKAIFSRSSRAMTDNNLKQAYLPQGCFVLDNDYGTAPGCIITAEGKTAVMLPGPPGEMRPMFANKVIPYLKEKSGSVILSKSLRVFGIGESSLETRLQDLMDSTSPTLAPYAKEGEVELRITAKCAEASEAQQLIDDMLRKVTERVGEYIYGYDDDTLESKAVGLLKAGRLTVSTAESCTGGLIAGAITSVPGSSEIFGYGFTTYSNEAKQTLLGVSGETLRQFGAVSEQTACEMAEGARRQSGSSLGVSATGIAGPDGGTPEKPVGLVYIALSDGRNTVCQKLTLSGNRDRVRKMTVMHVLDKIIKYKG